MKPFFSNREHRLTHRQPDVQQFLPDAGDAGKKKLTADQLAQLGSQKKKQTDERLRRFTVLQEGGKKEAADKASENSAEVHALLKMMPEFRELLGKRFDVGNSLRIEGNRILNSSLGTSVTIEATIHSIDGPMFRVAGTPTPGYPATTTILCNEIAQGLDFVRREETEPLTKLYAETTAFILRRYDATGVTFRQEAGNLIGEKNGEIFIFALRGYSSDTRGGGYNGRVSRYQDGLPLASAGIRQAMPDLDMGERVAEWMRLRPRRAEMQQKNKAEQVVKKSQASSEQTTKKAGRESLSLQNAIDSAETPDYMGIIRQSLEKRFDVGSTLRVDGNRISIVSRGARVTAEVEQETPTTYMLAGSPAGSGGYSLSRITQLCDPIAIAFDLVLREDTERLAKLYTNITAHIQNNYNSTGVTFQQQANDLIVTRNGERFVFSIRTPIPGDTRLRLIRWYQENSGRLASSGDRPELSPGIAGDIIAGWIDLRRPIGPLQNPIRSTP